MQQLQNKIKIQSVKVLILSRNVLVYFYSVIKHRVTRVVEKSL